MAIRKSGPKVQQEVPVNATASAQEARRIEEKKQKRLDPSQLDLPERQPGLGEARSVFHEVIQAGLVKLAKAQSWEAQDNALDVLVKAMAGASAHVDAGPAPDMLPMEFQRLLREFSPEPAKAAEVKRDAKQLVQLAVVALGTEGLEGMRKSEQEAQLATDVSAVHAALAEVLRLPDGERAERLQRSQDGLSWAANVFSRGQKALDAAQVAAPARLDALAGMLRIVLAYARPVQAS